MENTPDDKVYIEIIADFNDKETIRKVKNVEEYIAKMEKKSIQQLKRVRGVRKTSDPNIYEQFLYSNGWYKATYNVGEDGKIKGSNRIATQRDFDKIGKSQSYKNAKDALTSLKSEQTKKERLAKDEQERVKKQIDAQNELKKAQETRQQLEANWSKIYGKRLEPEEKDKFLLQYNMDQIKKLKKEYVEFGDAGEEEFKRVRKEVGKYQRAINKLNEKIQNRKEQEQEQLNLQKKIRQQNESENVRNWRQIMEENLSGKELDTFRLQNLRKDLKELEEQYIETGDTSQESFEKTMKKVKELRKQIVELEKRVEPKKMSGFKKLFNTLTRVGFYRIASNLFRYIESGFSTGLQNLAKFAPEINKLLSIMTSQFTIWANSISISLMPIIKAFEPLLKGLTSIIANLGTAFSYLGYKLGLTAKWFKINKDYLKDLNNESKNFSFDKFESLSGADDTSNMFIEMTGADGLTDDIKNIIDLINITIATLGVLASYKIIDWIIDEKYKTLLTSLSQLNDGLTVTDSKMSTIASTFAFVYDAYKILKLIIDLIDNWDSKTLANKVWSILKILSYGLSAVATLLGTIKKDPLLISAGIAGTIATAYIDSIPRYANGGMVDSGSLFFAGEAGAEFVTTMPNGSTGVTNVAQFKQAMLEALWDWSGSEDGGDIVLNLDGAEIARSKRFKNELNRTNTSLNLR